MASKNQYRDYIKLPAKKEYRDTVHFGCNAKISGANLEGFSLRLFARNEKKALDGPEIGVHLRPEEWLDLIDAMKAVFEAAQQARDK